MNFSYYPGCTLKNKAQDLDRWARLSAEALGIHLEELETWQCCGGAYSMGKDEIASKLASVRALQAAKEKGQDLVTTCSSRPTTRWPMTPTSPCALTTIWRWTPRIRAKRR